MQFEKIVDLDVAHGRAATLDLGPMLYQDDINSIKLGVRLRNGSEPVEVEGDVVGRALLSNGETITIESGDKEGSEAWVVIPQAALEVPGRVEYFMRIYDTDTTAVALYAYGYVRRTATGTIIVPGDPLPDVEQLREIAANCVTATETAQGVVNTAVQYTAQTKTAAEQAQARGNIGAAGKEELDTLGGVYHTLNVTWQQGSISYSGANFNDGKRIRTPAYYSSFSGCVMDVRTASGYEAAARIYTSTSPAGFVANFPTEADGAWAVGGFRLAVPAGYYVRFLVRKTGDAGIAPEDGETVSIYRINGLAENLAPYDTETAANTHAVGDLLTVGGTLYKATQAIAPGDAIAAGTNVTATSVAEQLAALEARIAALEG